MKQPIVIGGMNRDMSQWRAEGNLAYDMRNMRIMSVDKDQTAAGLSNERGPLLMNVKVHGTPIGSFTINEWFGIFSYEKADDGPGYSYVTVYKKIASKDEYDYIERLRYIDSSGTLDFGASLPENNLTAWRDGVQAIPSYESATSIRVYWIDSVHELRVMDFLDLLQLCERGELSYTDDNGVTVISSSDLDPNYFSYLPIIRRIDDVTVTKSMTGSLASGTVQFCITEVVNANESNIAYYSPLYYCSDDNAQRGFPDDNEEAGVSFNLTWRLHDADETVGMRCFVAYCIYRPTRGGTPMVFRREVDVKSYDQTFTTTFTGSDETTSGDYLLYKNSLKMTGMRGLSMKDNTLFLANYKKKTSAIMEGMPTLEKIQTATRKPLETGSFNGHSYSHSSQLKYNSWETGHFKRGQEYILGYQLMDATGAWGEPVFCGFHKMDKSATMNDSSVYLPYFTGVLATETIPEAYKAVRPVVAYVGRDRERYKCQGIVTPTIFCESERATGQCYAKYSPFARTWRYFMNTVSINDAFLSNPKQVLFGWYNGSSLDVSYGWVSDDPNGESVYNTRYFDYGWKRNTTGFLTIDIIDGVYPANQHLEALGSPRDYNCEIQANVMPTEVLYRTAIYPSENVKPSTSTDTASQFLKIDNSKYYVDCSTVTVNSPDITDETGDSVASGKMSLVGSILMNGFSSDCDIVAGAAPQYEGNKFVTGFIGYKPFSEYSGRCAMTLPNWCAPNVNGSSQSIRTYWAVYPFQRPKGLSPVNNDPTGGEFSQLEYKQLANYRYGSAISYFDEAITYEDSILTYASGKQGDISVINFDDEKRLYKGAEDTIVNCSATQSFTNGPGFGKNRVSSPIYTPLVRSIPNRVSLLMGLSASFANTNAFDLSMETTYSIPPTQMRLVPASGFYFSTIGESVVLHDENWVSEYKASLNMELTSRTDVPNVSSTSVEFRGDSSFTLAPLHEYMGNDGDFDADDVPETVAVNLKYCASPHVVCKLGVVDGKEKVLPNTGYLLSASRVHYDNYSTNKWFSLWNKKYGDWDDACPFDYAEVKETQFGEQDQLWLADIINNDKATYTEELDVTAGTAWYIAGPDVWFEVGDEVELNWYQGDWYFQRYEALRTYASSTTDTNQYVEIVSFYCETKTNIDGRYDKNRGRPFLQANPTNFNLINDSYTQLPDYFVYTQYSKASNVEETFPNQITWSLPKVLNSQVDEWTSITGATTLDLDGDKGEVTSLVRYKDYIYAFQQSGLAIVMFNSRAAIPTDIGVPIQLGSSGKVEGKQYVSNEMGALYHRQIQSTDAAIYFIDAFNRSFTSVSQEGPGSISERNGFHVWMVDADNTAQFLLRDEANKCIWINDDPDLERKNPTLSYSEKLQAFESFYDYDNVLENINVQDDTLLLHYDNDYKVWEIWRINAGEYNEFFRKLQPYWVDFISRGGIGQGYNHSNIDKVFNNVEYRGDLFYQYRGEIFAAARSPFNRLRVYTEYQDTTSQSLVFRKDWHQNLSNLKQKFRIWDAIIPRDEKGVYSKPHFKNRIRNPWAHVVLRYEPNNAYVRDIEGVGTNLSLDKCRALVQGIEVAYTS